MNQVSITTLGVTRSTLRNLLESRKAARRDMTAVMPFTRHWAMRTYRMLNLRIAAELMHGARSRKSVEV